MKINLKHHFLIAMPNMKNSIFQKSIIYLFEHNQLGAMGIIINKPFKNIKMQNILYKLNIFTSKNFSNPQIHKPVMFGGPVQPDQGLIIHYSNKYFYSSTYISETIMITTSKDILDYINILNKSNQMLFILGYCIWSNNQLKKELLNNFWIVSLANHDILFHTPNIKKWTTAIKICKINQINLYNNF